MFVDAISLSDVEKRLSKRKRTEYSIERIDVESLTLDTYALLAQFQGIGGLFMLLTNQFSSVYSCWSFRFMNSLRSLSVNGEWILGFSALRFYRFELSLMNFGINQMQLYFHKYSSWYYTLKFDLILFDWNILFETTLYFFVFICFKIDYSSIFPQCWHWYLLLFGQLDSYFEFFRR